MCIIIISYLCVISPNGIVILICSLYSITVHFTVTVFKIISDVDSFFLFRIAFNKIICSLQQLFFCVFLQALADYNSNPYDLNASKITFSEIYDKWSEKKFEMLVDSSGYKSAFNLSKPLHNMRFADIKTDNMQVIIDNSKKGYATRKNIKILYGQLFKYAMERDVVGKDYSRFVSMGKNDKESTRKPFTQKEIDKLWKKVGLLPNVDAVLISKKTLPLIKKRFDLTNSHLMTDEEGNGISYNRYYDWFMVLMEQLNMSHKPHDTRHTFATLMSNAEANKVSIKRIMGHASTDVTEGYTHKDIEKLIKAIDLI